MPQSLLPFEDFLSYLQQQNFNLGVDDFLQIQTLLNRLPKDCPPEKLKRLICPLVASNEAEQILFYQAFDRHFSDLALQCVDLEEMTPPASAPLEKADEKLEKYHKYGEELEWSLKSFFYQEFQTIVISTLVLFLLTGVGFVYFNMQKDEQSEKSKPKKTTHYDSNYNEYETPSKKNNNSDYPTSLKKDNNSDYQIPSKKNPTAKSTKPYAPSIPSKEYINQKGKDTSMGFIEFVCWLLLIFSVWMFMLHFKIRNEFYLEALENITPPQYWNIQVPKSELNLAHSQAFKHAANRLQKRRMIPTQKVDVPETVQATIAAAGFPDFKYLQTSVLPEYLLLIDQSSTKDQQTKWFDRWFEALKEREVLVHRFFYHGNPEWCWDEEQNYISLVELYHRFGDCRLVLIPPPLSPSEGKGKFGANSLSIPPPLEGIKGRFEDWQEKVLLSTHSLSKSAAEYLEEESGFVVLPAKVESLHQLSDIFEGEGAISAKPSTYPSLITTDLEKLSVSEAVAELKRVLTDVGFECLCAAAVYPEMNWDLTLYLGETLYDERELLKEENMLPLVSLSYFRKGFMPEDLRKVLIEKLDEDNKRLVKEAILHLLQLHPLVDDEYSAEFFDYQLHIALQDAQLHPQDQYKLSTLQHLMEEKEFGKSRYKQVILRFLQTKDKSFNLDGILGTWFKKEDEMGAVEAIRNQIRYGRPFASERLGAILQDVLSVAFFTTIFSVICYLFLGSFLNIVFLTAFVFLAMDVYKKEQSIGKKRKGLCVIDVNRNTHCNYLQAFLRRCPDIIMLLFLYLGYRMGLSSEITAVILTVISFGNFIISTVHDGRRIGDYLAGTQVVYEDDYDYQRKTQGKIRQRKKKWKETSIRDSLGL